MPETESVRMKQEAKAPPFHNRIAETRLTEILDIATEVFVSEGFSGASLNDIARRSNSSKRTFYSRFPTKEHLFIAVIERRMDGMFDELLGALPQEPSLEETLSAFGTRFVRNTLTSDQIALQRVICMESTRFPMLAERFLELGPKRIRAALSQYFAGQISRGRLIRTDTTVIAQHYVSLVTGGDVRLFSMGLQSTPLRPNELRKHLNEAIGAFLRAYAVNR